MDRRRAVADTDPDDRRSVVGKGAIQGGSDPLGLLDLDAEQTEWGPLRLCRPALKNGSMLTSTES